MTTKTYLLPCECSARIAVGAGQAGGSVVCPQCGATVAVPRLGSLSILETRPEDGAATLAWTWAHGCLLVGATLAAILWAAAAFVAAWPQTVVNEAGIRAVVAAADDRSVYEEWKSIMLTGLARPPSVQEEQLQQRSRSARTVAGILRVVAGLATAIAVAGAVAIVASRSAEAAGETAP